MDGTSAKKSSSFETLVIQNISNVNELKAKLNDIIKSGANYEYDISSCMKTLLKGSDQEILLLSVIAISELVKCREKREIFAQKDIIEPILTIIQRETTSESIELVKNCCRALGNLFCDCDRARQAMVELDGITILIKFLTKCIDLHLNDIQSLSTKVILNFCIGGQKFSEAVVEANVVDVIQRILSLELKKDELDYDTVSTCLLVMSVINDHISEILFDEVVNRTVLKVLQETSNLDISELCLDHLHVQTEHDSVKTLLAKEGGMHLVCERLERLVNRHNGGGLHVNDVVVESIMKQACELMITVLTGDEAMHILYNHGMGEVYKTSVKWLDSENYQLVNTAVLAIGNFARQDDYCMQMMEDKIFDKLLDIFETFNNYVLEMQREPEKQHPVSAITVIKVLHAVLSSLRNLTVPVANKRAAFAQGRAAPLLINALTNIEDHHVAYKLLAAIRLLLDGQEGVAMILASNSEALAGVARWGQSPQYTGASGEAPRLLAWAVKLLRHHTHWRYIVQVDGCIASLVNMLVSSHSVMQNEAILALTLLGIESLKVVSPDSQTEYNYEKSYIDQLIRSEIGEHVTILVDSNCGKMPVEVAENLLAFLEVTSKNQRLAFVYKEAKVQESLQKFSDSRNDLSGDMIACIFGVISAILKNSKSN